MKPCQARVGRARWRRRRRQRQRAAATMHKRRRNPCQARATARSKPRHKLHSITASPKTRPGHTDDHSPLPHRRHTNDAAENTAVVHDRLPAGGGVRRAPRSPRHADGGTGQAADASTSILAISNATREPRRTTRMVSDSKRRATLSSPHTRTDCTLATVDSTRVIAMLCTRGVCAAPTLHRAPETWTKYECPITSTSARARRRGSKARRQITPSSRRQSQSPLINAVAKTSARATPRIHIPTSDTHLA